MGASSSSPSLESTSASSSSTPAALPTKMDLGSNSASSETTPRSESSKKNKIPPNLSGPALIEYRCRKKKRAFSACVSGFYENKFLPGEKLEQEGDCDDLFEHYRECYMSGMLKARQKKGLAPPKPNTLLAEFVEEEGIEPGSKA